MKDAFGIDREAISKGGLRRVAVKVGTKVANSPRVANRLDQNANRTAGELLPAGTKLANGARVKGHSISRTPPPNSGKNPNAKKGFLDEIGANRYAETTIARGRKNIGSVTTVQLPTKHAFVGRAFIKPEERGKGVGTSMMDTAVRNAKGAHIPAFGFAASKTPDAGSRAKRIGANVWRRDKVKYMPYYGINPGKAGQAKLDKLPDADRQSAEKFMRKARTGRVKPAELKSKTTPAAAAAMDRMTWAGYVKGGEPMGRKTMIGGAAAGSGAIAVNETKKGRTK
jgi:predicted GNAT family acetyltransferase